MVLALAAVGAHAQVIDGTADASYGSALFVQNIGTGFGNSTSGTVDVANGSEVDGLYGRISGGNLFLVVTGNLESNFNHLALFVDTGTGGFNTLPGDNAFGGDFGYFNGLSGLTFDTGFKAGYGIEMRNGNTPNTLYVDMASLGSTGAGILDAANDNGGGVAGVVRHVVDASGFELALNNSNVGGVDGNSGAAESGAGVLTGAELKIPLALLGNPTGSLRVAGFVTGGNFVSNQVIGGLPTSTGNVGSPPLDFNQYAGNQYATVSPVPEPASMAALALGVLALIRKRRAQK